MRTYIKIFSACHYIAQAAIILSNFVLVVQKRLAMNKFVRIKSPTGSKFSKIIIEQLYTRWTVVVYLYCGFSMWRQMAPQRRQIQNRVFWSISYQFEEG